MFKKNCVASIYGGACVELVVKTKNLASSTFLVGKRAGMGFSGGAYDTGKDVSADIGAG
jgi:hypothetical protein